MQVQPINPARACLWNKLWRNNFFLKRESMRPTGRVSGSSDAPLIISDRCTRRRPIVYYIIREIRNYVCGCAARAVSEEKRLRRPVQQVQPCNVSARTDTASTTATSYVNGSYLSSNMSRLLRQGALPFNSVMGRRAAERRERNSIYSSAGSSQPSRISRNQTKPQGCAIRRRYIFPLHHLFFGLILSRRTSFSFYNFVINTKIGSSIKKFVNKRA